MIIAVDNGVLRDVEVVGFHGLVVGDTTPQRKAPVYGLGGSPLRIAGTPWSAAATDAAAFEGELYERDDVGEATLFAVPIEPARAGSVLVIVGSWETTYLAREPAGVHATDPRVGAFVRSLSSPLVSNDERCRAVPGDDTARAWYAPLAAANALLELVRRRAKVQFLDGDDRAGLEAAWKLFAAAPGQPDESRLAVAMLHSHGFEDWREIAADDPEGGTPDEVLARGQRSLEALRRTRVPGPQSPDPTGPDGTRKADYRSTLRSQGASWRPRSRTAA